MTNFERFMLNFRHKLYADDANEHVEQLSRVLFQAYSQTHEAGHLIDRLTMTPAGAYFCAQSERAGLTDQALWSLLCDTLSDNEIIELMQAWVPEFEGEKSPH